MAISDANRPPNLLLAPTVRERRVIESCLSADEIAATVAVCGVGPVMAASLASQVIHRTAPRRVVLAGIAGTYCPESLGVGTACCFRQVAIDGIGAGEGSGFVPAERLGPDGQEGDAARFGGPLRLDLAVESAAPRLDLLLTCCAASDCAVMASRRRSRFPDAAAEDMEGYAVAMVCHLAGVPLTIVRGISNVVGDRDHHQWQVESAMQSVVDVLREEM